MPTKTVSGFRQRIKLLTKEINRVALPSVRSFIAEVRKGARKDLRRTALGKALWTKRGRTSRRQGTRPPLVLKTIRARLSRTEGAWIGGIRLKGFAALIETGGRTAPHTIRARSAPALVFRVDGTLIRTQSVRHPGSSIRRRPFIQKRMRGSIQQVQRVMSRNMNRLFKRVVL